MPWRSNKPPVSPARILVIAIAAACQSGIDRGPAITHDLPGAAITHDGPASVLTWTGDDSEIVFSVGRVIPPALKAFRVADGVERTLDFGKDYRIASSIPRASEVYYVADVSPTAGVRDMRLYQASSGRELATLQDLTAFAVAPDGRTVAFARGRADIVGLIEYAQAFILNLSNGRSSELVTCNVPRRFSPDASQLLCLLGRTYQLSSGTWYTDGLKPTAVDLASGAPAALSDPFGTSNVSWTSSGLRVVYRSNTHTGQAVVEGTAAQRTILKAEDAPGIILDLPVWSPDGTLVAFWKEECHDSEPVCSRRVRLVVANVAHGTSSVVAVGDDRGGAIAFSNDARRIAYALDGAVRLRTRP